MLVRVQDYIQICGHEGPTLDNLTLGICIILCLEQQTVGITLPKKTSSLGEIAEDHLKKVKLILSTDMVP